MKNGLKPISEMTEEEVIKHFGVKGMRWGVRRARKRAASYKKAVDSDTSMARFVAAKPIRDAVKGVASKASNSKLAKALKSYKESVDSDTSPAKFIVAKPLRDKLKSVLSRKGNPDAIRAGKKEHMDSYESAAKKVEKDGAAKVSKIKGQKKEHMDSYESEAVEVDKKGQSDKAKAIRDEASTIGKDWDKAISKTETKTTNKAKAIRDEALDMGKEWDKAIARSEVKHGVDGVEFIGSVFVESFIKANKTKSWRSLHSSD